MLAKNIMGTRVITVSPLASITEAAQLMRDEDIGALVVVDKEERPVGIITDRDIVVSVVAYNENPAEVVVGEVMTKNLHVVQEDASVFEVLKVLGKHSIRRVPVMRKDRLVGIISVDDLIVVITTELSNLASALSSTSRVV
ncbi:MAG TPA: CBS domain-containing protein [Thermodesulfobacteriota bacterium]|jgi:CBS domain-containing protein|nr:CBS domain-containing protein [Thermodesulfobacteriota bacterium]